MLERGSYYGFRSLIVLYMINEAIALEDAEAVTIFSSLVTGLLISQVIGALVGDLLIGNRKAIIIGGLIQAIGVFTLCIPSVTGLYSGLFLILLGNGLYTPNIISNFGKAYLKKEKLLDSGFALLYLAMYLGSFLGIILIGFWSHEYSFSIGFITSGILMLISTIPILFTEEKFITAPPTHNKLYLNKNNINIAIMFVVVGLFWAIYEVLNFRFYDLQLGLKEVSTLPIPKPIWETINSVFILPVTVIIAIVWTYFYSSQYFKLMLGFIFGVVSFGILFLIPKTPTDQHTIIFLISLLFLGFAEAHIAPIVYATITKYSNPKYLAIIISLAFIPTRGFALIFGLFNETFYNNPTLGVTFGIITMSIIAIGLYGVIVWNRKSPSL